MANGQEISKRLQELVSWSVATLGEAIQAEYGQKTYRQIESLRRQMKKIRGKSPETVYQELSIQLKKLQKNSDNEVHQLCSSFTLMLELINRCETAYRAHRLDERDIHIPKKKPHAIIFVLTAHPTEARSPELLGIFENIQSLLLHGLRTSLDMHKDELYHLILIALKISLARKSKPSVKDEAQNIYSYILRDDVLDMLVYFSKNDVNVSLRTWVGGDKDGHPGVNEKTMQESLSQSRKKLASYIEKKLERVLHNVSYIQDHKMLKLVTKIEYVQHQVSKLKTLKNSDGVRITEFKKSLLELIKLYEKRINFRSPELECIERIMWVFPALVVALEVREDSSVVKDALNSTTDLAITRMLKKLKDISYGFDSKWYVRGFVLSMVESHQDVENGFKLVKKVFNKYQIPVVPLFENEKALVNAKTILTTYLNKHKKVISTHQKKWGSRFEVMVGYSDSSKENGVFPSRLMISSALQKIEKTLKVYELTPVFFHGSGGSIERGGGSLREQTGWWPKSAINTFKATIQGEMVARNFGTSQVLTRQIEVILDQLGSFNSNKKSHSKTLMLFSRKIKARYSQKIQDNDFLSVIELATPYSFLHHLKIGSRPTKRAGGAIKNNLRAIPWILCWTQTRILFPTWWGVGSSWDELSNKEKNELKKEYKKNPVLISYVKALGFTLAKVELGVWKLYLENSDVPSELSNKTIKEFTREYNATKKFFREVSGENQFLWFRPWLQQSIDLRSSMIHPVNLCQLESLRRGDHELLRKSVTGIACGMLTTG